MATPFVPQDRTHLPRRTALYEGRREREFYRYYEPIRSLTDYGPPLCNLRDAESVKSHQPVSSPDPALTAFCQLGALRLGTRRAMLFFFDSQYAFVLAEATRTLSLKDDSVHEIEDHLWLGHCVIPRGYSICEETVCALPERADQDAGQENHDRVHIITDLENDVNFCDRPFVMDGPKARFYAGVPITTPNGVNIGAYCCLDDKTHPEGLGEKGISFLKDMASTVMTHLEMVRAKAEHERGTHMISSLGAFIEEGSSSRNEEPGSLRRGRRKTGQPQLMSSVGNRPPVKQMLPKRIDPTPPVRRRSSESTQKATSAESVPTLSDMDSVPAGVTPAPKSGTDNGDSRSGQSAHHTEDVREHLVAANIRTAFDQAAHAVRQAADADGCVFLDATVGTYGGLVESHTGTDHNSDALLSETGTESEGRRVVEGRGTLDKKCKVLASSHTSQDIYSASGDLQKVADHNLITEKFLRALLRRYPRGKIWNFNQAGDASSDDESSESSRVQREPDGETPRNSASEVSEGSHTRTGVRRRKKARIDDGREVQRLFPGVRSLAIVGMWDQSRARWYAACAIWTYSPLRLFSQESEVAYLSAFNDVLLAQVHRIEAQNSDQAKSDFISSISHELRSPLHGILGSVECLQEQEIDSFSAELAGQIEICGRTLLDIVDHLLDFSKINHSTRNRVANGGGILSQQQAANTAKMSPLGGILAQDVQVSLDKITEEVVATAVYSFCCSRDKQTVLERRVAVIMDVDRSSHASWKCWLPVGGWKRICINLVSNALKYTAEGFVRIGLKAEPIPGKRKRFNAVFSVSDSGRGMSRQFLDNHLFRAFAQEDTLVEGTGLGMSLVAKIIKAMGGKIEVQSEKNSGTTMTVTVPMKYNPSDREANDQPRPLEGTSLGTLGLHDAEKPSTGDSHQQARKLLWNNIQNCCSRLGVRSRRVDWSLQPGADVYLITEQDLAVYQHHRQRQDVVSASGVQNPIVVLCNNAISQRHLKAEPMALEWMSSHVELISQPCEPERLANAISACLAKQKAAHEPGQSQNAAEAGATSEHTQGRYPATSTVPRTGETQTLPLRTRDAAPQRPNSSRKSVRVAVEPKVAKKPRSPRRISDRRDEGIHVRSKSDSGRPQSPIPVDADLPKRPSIREVAGDPAKDALCLLLVDDNQINLQLLVNYARKQGHHRLTATDGAQAVQAYKSACLATAAAAQAGARDGPPTPGGAPVAPTASPKPQVILMDISMPVLNGFEATRRIRAFEQQHGVPPARIIALTGLGSAGAQQEAFSSGIDLFLTKPVRLKELSGVLEEVRKAVAETGEGGHGEGRGAEGWDH